MKKVTLKKNGMSNILNIGIIGTGLMAEIYAKIIKQRFDCKLVAVTGNTSENTFKFAHKFDIVGYSDSLYDLMFQEHPEIEAVIIATPEWIRIDPIISSIKFNQHILLEKPFTNSIESAYELRKLLEGYSNVFEICHVLRHSPKFYALNKSIKNGDIGDIRHIYARRNSNNLRVKRVLGKTDLAFWLTPHDVDIMRWITNSEISEVYALSRNQLQTNDDYLTSNLKFKNGVDAVLQISWCNPPLSGISREAVFEVWGNKGYIEVEDYNMNVNIFSENQRVESCDTYEDFEINGVHHGMFENLIDHFIRRTRLNDIKGNNLDDAFQSINICDMISKSIKQHCVIFNDRVS